MEDTELIQTEDITYPPIEKGWLERSAHIVSLVFNPFIVTTAVFVMLFGCTYLRMLPAFYKQIAIGTTFSFTTFIPLTGIFVYLKLNKFYILTLLSEFDCGFYLAVSSLLLSHFLELSTY